jgi:hypothetical protein
MDEISYQEFLSTKIKNLELDLESSMNSHFEKIKKELKEKNINLWPDFYFGDEWGCYDKTISISIPFFLAKQELKALEGYVPSNSSLIKILRHETGHAVNYAFKLWKRKDWKETFGDFNKRYSEKYLNKVNPWSKSYVKHLHYVDDGKGSDPHYAQKHPDEDWAETFAVWLYPKSGWKTKYQNWPVALSKLEYIDQLMTEIAGQKPVNTKTKRDGDYTTIEDTISEWWGLGEEILDSELQEYLNDMNELFIKPSSNRRRMFPAYILIRKYTRALTEEISEMVLGSNKNSVRRCLRIWEKMCRDEGLRYSPDEETKKIMDLSSLLTYHVLDGLDRIK